MTNKYISSFSVAVTGDRTFDQYVGDFEIKTMLSYDEQLNEDRIRREFLSGPAEIPAGGNAQSIANVFSYLQARIVKAPTWWTESRNGLSLYDNNVVAEVFKLASEAEAEQLKTLKEKAEAAKKKLAESAPVTDK